MVIWPKEVSRNDVGWQQAVGLMSIATLELRRPVRNERGRRVQAFVTSADDLLVRPTITAERRRVEAPYFQYRLAFDVAVTVHGAIAVDSYAELEEFRRTVNAAIAARRQRTASVTDHVAGLYGATYVAIADSPTRHEDTIRAFIARGRAIAQAA
ncbi:MAG: hypothetical protein AzoDbin1_01860 [Azoarcus sp.]|nr:hypothetical protein [Azoarcus sp.]